MTEVIPEVLRAMLEMTPAQRVAAMNEARNEADKRSNDRARPGDQLSRFTRESEIPDQVLAAGRNRENLILISGRAWVHGRPPEHEGAELVESCSVARPANSVWINRWKSKRAQ